jgi:ferredoxin-NADP reductase/cytochrome b involved in lipid metabolism
MKNTDMAVIFFENFDMKLQDKYSTGHYWPSDDTNLGGENDFNDIDLEYEDGWASASFTRDQESTEKYDESITVGLVTDVCFAWSDGMFFHGENWEVGEMKFGKTKKDSYYHEYFKYRDNWFSTHRDLMTICWMVLVHLAVISARYFKWWPYWLFLHVGLNLTVIIMTIVTSIGVYQVNKNIYFAYTSDQRYHSIIGLNLNSILIFQGILGICTRYFIGSKKTTTPIIFLRRLHAGTGLFLLVFGLAEVWIGWKMYDGFKKKVIACMFALIVLVYIVCEALKIFSVRFSGSAESLNSENSGYVQIQNKNSVIKAYKKIISSKQALVIFEDKILDLTQFIPSHPGGASMLNRVIGKEVGKYISGSASLFDFNPHSHSSEAYSILKTLSLETIGYDSEILQGTGSQDEMIWTVSDIFKICESTSCITLTSEIWSVFFPKGSSWLGKSLIITSDKLMNVKRYYSIVLSNLNNWEEETKDIRLYIKTYDLGKVSKYLTSLTVGASLRIEGPVGLGLLLKQLKTGNYFAFAAGTGINPFIDLLRVIWNGEAPEGFYLNFFISFQSQEDAYGLEVFKNVEKKISHQLKLHIFFKTDGVFMSFTQIKQIFALGSVKKIWICGPNGYCQFIRDICGKCGISEKLVLIL